MMNFHYALPFVALSCLWHQAGSSSPAEIAQEENSVASSPVIEVPTDAFPAPVQPAAVPNDVDLALCLDTSGSMQGLLDSARQRLWSLVNELALAEPTPRLRVALLTYGTPGYGADSGYVRTALPLTEDLDMVSLRLFELTTNGGDEYVARVTQTATSALAWSTEPGALKMIVVAGNESAEQDPAVTLEVACGAAIEKGIVVHSLYCDETGQGRQSLLRNAAPVQTLGGGSQTAASQAAAQQTAAQPSSATQSGVAPASTSTRPAPLPLSDIALGWKKVALLADGAFAMIQTEHGAPVIETPFDTLLMDLSSRLNNTYIPYGSGSAWALSNQVAQDGNASGLNNDAAAGRAMSKAGKLYYCSWDLLDSLAKGQMAFEEIDREQLPKALRELSTEALQTHVEEKRAARVEIQTEIAETGQKREAWLVQKRLETGSDDSTAFDTPLRKAFRELAQARGFRFAAPSPSESASEPTDQESASSSEAAPAESPVLEVTPTAGE